MQSHNVVAVKYGKLSNFKFNCIIKIPNERKKKKERNES